MLSVFRSTLVAPTLIVCIVKMSIYFCVKPCFGIPLNLDFILQSSFLVYNNLKLKFPMIHELGAFVFDTLNRDLLIPVDNYMDFPTGF